IFIAGNHDWSHGDADGLAALKRQENFINQSHGSGSKLLPSAGCPGPVAIDSKGIRIIALDSHWWFEDNLKPDTSCQQTSKDEVALKLKELVNDADARRVVVVAHHPLLTYGPHGGFYDWKDHLFPLTNIAEWLWIPMPIIGSLYPLTRAWLVRSDQDLSGAKNKAMVRALKEVLSTGEVLIYAAGHEHTLQVLEGGQVVDYLLVSGAGSEVKTTSVGHGDVTLFAHLHTGFMAVDFLAEGRVLLSVIEPGEKEIVFRKWLKE
ncbi:MAG: hypothetical protein GWN62_23440, partial [Aliifodinibius sp.]|nr:hypothetical protein [Fodinibius sp.]